MTPSQPSNPLKTTEAPKAKTDSCEVRNCQSTCIACHKFECSNPGSPKTKHCPLVVGNPLFGLGLPGVREKKRGDRRGGGGLYNFFSANSPQMKVKAQPFGIRIPK